MATQQMLFGYLNRCIVSGTLLVRARQQKADTVVVLVFVRNHGHRVQQYIRLVFMHYWHI